MSKTMMSTLTMLFGALSFFTHGFTGMYLFNWFISPLVGITIGFMQALGLKLAITFFTYNPYGATKEFDADEHKSSLKSSIFVATYPLIMLVIGYIYKMFL